MNRKIILLSISTGLILLIISVLGIRFVHKSETSKQVDANDEKFSMGISMMLENEAGSSEYVKAEDSSWADVYKKGYSFNAEKSTCKNGSNLSWNETNKTIIFSGNTTDNCIIYFNKDDLTIADYIVSRIYSQDGVDGLYYHDGVGTYTNANLEAGDNSYRYSGANPNNYLCFKEGCTDEEKYRIIGVIDGKVKVIKMTNDGNKAWNDAGNNTWEGSTMEAYLNGEYLTNLKNIANLDTDNLIDITTWYVGGFTLDQLTTENAKGIYTAEISSTELIDKKIGLMYVNEYMYAAEPKYWNLVGWNSDAAKGYQASKDHDWMFSSDYPWTISRSSDYSNYAIYVYSDGSANNGGSVSGMTATHPSFSLKSLVKLKSGSGTSNDPFIVGL